VGEGLGASVFPRALALKPAALEAPGVAGGSSSHLSCRGIAAHRQAVPHSYERVLEWRASWPPLHFFPALLLIPAAPEASRVCGPVRSSLGAAMTGPAPRAGATAAIVVGTLGGGLLGFYVMHHA